MAAKSKKASQAKKAAVGSAVELSRWVAAESVLFHEPSPFRAAVDEQDPKLVVVTGENASGKSLFVRVVGAILQNDGGGTPVTVSIRERTGSGMNEMSGMRRVMMFGDEHEQSTGAASVKVVAASFNNVDRDNGCILILDEPDIGLAESYARALGEFIATKAKDLPANCGGVIVVTHSRPLVQGLLAGYERTPSHVAVTAQPDLKPGLQRWLDDVEHRSVQELLNLSDVGHERWLAVNKILKS
jgi:hypothetical protein